MFHDGYGERTELAGVKDCSLICDWASITHLKIDPTHPLAAEVQAYQRQRIRKLMLQDSRGFTAELMTIEPRKSKKRSKGFGN